LFFGNLNILKPKEIAMSQLTIRTPQDANLDICESEWNVYQDDGTWFRIDPVNDLRVRHGSNEYWLTIECDSGVDYCPPEEMVECWPGYAGDFDSGEFKTGGPTGYLVSTCDGLAPKTYTGHTPNFDVAGGRFFATAPLLPNTVAEALPVTLYGETAEINEMLVWAGSASGAIDVSALELDPGVRFRIYHGCELLGDSKTSGNYFNIFYNAEPPELREVDCGVPRPANNFLTVRVDAPANARWRIKLGEVNVVQLTNYERPAPCFGTFGPNLPCRVNEDHRVVPGAASYEMVHRIPANGIMHIDLTVQGVAPVTVSVFYNGGMIAQAASLNSGTNQYSAISIPFNFTSVGGDDFIIVRYDAPRNYNKWQYSIYCPEQRGSRVFPMFCMPVPDDVLCLPLNPTLDPVYAQVGQGAQYNDIYYDYSGKAEGDVVVEFFAADPVQMIFYQGTYPNDIVVGGTDGFVQGHQRFYFEFYPKNGTTIHVRVLGPCCPDWAMTVSCPVPFARLIIDDGSKVRLKKGEVNYLCFRARLNHRTPRDVNFSFKTTPLDAIEAQGDCIIPGSITPSLYCDILSETGVQFAYSTNDVNIGGYGAYRICSQAHGYNCAQGGQYYVMETEINLPYDGVYTWVGTADDNCYIYLDCELKVQKSSTWEANQQTNFVGRKGLQTLSIMYQNVPHCTPGWVKCAILGNGQVVFATNASAYQWRSKTGSLTSEPVPEPLNYGADYNKTQSTGHIPACSENGIDICVPICGTDLMGPNVQFKVEIYNLTGVKAERPAAIGTIINENNYQCDQATLVAVNDGGACEFVNRLSRRMFVQKALASYGGASYVMEREMTFPVSGIYTFIFFGKDGAQLYMDCNLIAQSSGGSVARATRVRTAVNRGTRHLFINYQSAGGGRRNAYASMCVLDPSNQIIYSSNAADWRGRIINGGVKPTCNQFATSCLISGNTIEKQQSGGGGSTNYTVGYGSVQVRTSLHGNGSQPNGINYSLQYTPNLPAGTYTVKWTADDVASFYVNCNHIRDKNSNWRDIDTFTFAHPGGAVPITVIYRNTGGNVAWCNWAILNGAGQAVSVSLPGLPGQASAIGDVVAGTVGVPLYQSFYGGRTVIHISPSIGSGGPNYNWWSAERDINIPADGLYYVVGGADDQLGVYVGCQAVSTAGGLFALEAGPQKMHIRCYNLKSKNPNYCWFTLYNQAGQVIYSTAAAGWKGKWSDLDFSGMS
jgi:hypothetical protein